MAKRPRAPEEIEIIDQLAGPVEEELEEDFFDPFPPVPPTDDPTLTPGNPQFNLKKYFQNQPKVTVSINRDFTDVVRDPEGKVTTKLPVVLNGFRIDVPMGVAVRLPVDFARFLYEIGKAQLIREASV